jgi:hypothetical protein
MSAIEFFAKTYSIAPAFLAAILLISTNRPRAAPSKLFFALLLTCYGSFGIVTAIHIAFSSTPLRLVLNVPHEYVLLTYTVETMLEIITAMVLAVFVAKKSLIPKWSAFVAA